ncbi:MAG: hypothetical protein ACYC6M_13220 [Terriglobales bacterium]
MALTLRSSLSAFLGLGLLGLAPQLRAAQLGSTAQAVLPATARQVISLDYHHLSQDPTAMRLATQVLPPEMKRMTSIFSAGGVNAAQDVDRITFATFDIPHGVELAGVAEGNLQHFNLNPFFKKTAKHPTPPEFHGTVMYHTQDLYFFRPDPNSLVFGDRAAVERLIDVQQGVVPRLDTNSNMLDLIAGTESTAIWSVLDAPGTRNMVQSLAGDTGKLSADTVAKHLRGSRYTVNVDGGVQLNLEMLADDSLSAAALSTGLRAAVLYRQYQEKNPVLKNLLSAIQVDAAGDHAFLQVSSDENVVSQLLTTDLFTSITH